MLAMPRTTFTHGTASLNKSHFRTTHNVTPCLPYRMLAQPMLRWQARLALRTHRASFSTTASRSADFTHAVIGGGVVGLAVARQLAEQHGASTVLIERHPAVGTETSSRNSEVIHAGIYYPPDSLKSRLCIRGKGLLYDLCARHGVGHRRTGKWIVAQTDAQRRVLEGVHARCVDHLGVPVRWVGEAEVRRDGEGVVAAAGALESPTTGIVDSHGLMMCLLGLFEDAGGMLALNSPVRAIRPLGGDTRTHTSTQSQSQTATPGRSGWEIDVSDGPDGDTSTITADTIVNAAGLAAIATHNMIVPPGPRRRTAYYAKGNYFSYAPASPAGRVSVSRLVYPVVEPGAGGLGTHLTLDLAGRVRFGPDVEWANSPEDLAVGGAERAAAAATEIRSYLPGVDAAGLVPDYAGMRPKLGPAGSGFHDFIVRKEDGYEGWVNLLGIESPGLTSSLAIGEMVGKLFYEK